MPEEDRDLKHADEYVKRESVQEKISVACAKAERATYKDLAFIEAMVRDAYLQGWHEAMGARDEDSKDRPCPYCGEGRPPGQEQCGSCGQPVVQGPSDWEMGR